MLIPLAYRIPPAAGRVVPRPAAEPREVSQFLVDLVVVFALHDQTLTRELVADNQLKH